jgi:hypothetical protein
VDLQKNDGAESVAEKEDLTAQVLDWARDRTVALEGSSTANEPKDEPKDEAKGEAKPVQESKTKPRPRAIVVALREGADDCGEAHLFEDLEAAGRFVETLVEDGLDQQRLGVFKGTQLDVHLTYRAVVRLKASEAEEEPTV